MYIQLGVWVSLCSRVSVLHFWETCYHTSWSGEGRERQIQNLQAAPRRRNCPEKDIPHSVETELPFLHGAIRSTHDTPAPSSAKHIKIPFKHTLQFCSVIKAAPVLSSFLESRSRHWSLRPCFCSSTSPSAPLSLSVEPAVIRHLLWDATFTTSFWSTSVLLLC